MTRKIEPPLNPSRFLPLLLKQPDPNDNPLELDESDVVWSDTRSDDSTPSLSPPATSSSSSSYPTTTLKPTNPTTTSYLFPYRRGFGLSAALSRDPPPLSHLRRTPTLSAAKLIPAAPFSGGVRVFPQSAPVNVPWPRKKQWYDEEDDEREGGGGEREIVPPHVMAGREAHVAAYSVFEGVGRTLKGRDLRSVRNAVFQKTGFLD